MIREGTRVGGTSLKVQGCFCMDIQIFEPIPPEFIQHKIELDTTIPPTHSGQEYVKCKLCYNSETGGFRV